MTLQIGANGVCSTNRCLPFPPSTIWGAFADAGRLARWWGPDGFQNTFEIFEFQPQGRWKFVMHGPDGKDYPNDSRFLEVSANKIVIRHDSQPHFTLSIALEDVGGNTRLLWQQAFDDPSLAESLAHIIIPANEQNLNRLQAVLEAGS